MHYPFLVIDPRSGLQYRLTDTGLAELSLAPIPPEWSPGRVIAEAPDPVWADSLANAPVETISAVTTALEDLVLATPDLRVPVVDHLPDGRAKQHLSALIGLWRRLGDGLPEGLAPLRHVLSLSNGRFLDPVPVVEGSLDPLAPAAMQTLYVRLKEEFGSVPASPRLRTAAVGSRLHALQGGVTAQRLEAAPLDGSLAFFGLRDPAAAADFTAARARALIDDGIPAREISVLTAGDPRQIARAFAAQGVPLSGLSTDLPQRDIIGETALHLALAFAANPADIHSGLLLRTLGPDPLPLQEALSSQIDGRLADDPMLMPLVALSARLASLPVGAGLDLVLDAAGLRPWADSQPDAAQSRADLLRLEAEAGEFEAAHRDLKAASGFHGETAKVFLGWLDARADERDFDRRPDPAANSAEAVEIVTWHASKGREWPITVVAEFDNGIEEWPGSTATRFDELDRIDDMAVVLGSAALIHTPGFAAPEAGRRFIEDRRPDFEANAKNLLYVALTRARDRLVLEWPGFLKDREEDAPEAKNLFHILEDSCTPQMAAGCLRIGGVDCPAVITQLPEQAGFTEYANGAIIVASRFGPATALPAAPLTPWRLQPSQARSAGTAPETRSIDLGAPWPKTLNDATRGTALHLALRTCLTRPDLIPALAAATGLEETMITLVSERAETLRNWLAAEGYTDLQAEIPVLGFSPEGAEIPGTIDLLAVGSEGCILIDHKSGGEGEGFGSYWPQLSSYMALVAKLFPHHPLKGVAVFWVDHGRLELAGP